MYCLSIAANRFRYIKNSQMKKITTPITYYGGKQSMTSHILPIIPPHKIYTEPFFGGGAVFFEKQPSYLEVINDTNGRLITFYEVMRDNFAELNHLISTTLHSEKLHQSAREIYHNRIPASKIEIAWSVWVLTNMSFSGTVYGGWKWDNGKSGSHSAVVIHNKAYQFKTLHNRLKHVQISSRDAIKVILERDSKDTFHYLDPPYPGANQKHYSGYSMNNFVELLEVISQIKGKFILSNFQSQTLNHYSNKNNWIVDRLTKNMNVANFSDPRSKTELLIRNYEIENNLFSKQ